jgi:hypothetical protein
MGSFVIIILLVGLLFVIISGIFLMGKGGAANLKYGNRLMTARVMVQALIMFVIFLMFFVGRK